LSGSSSLISLWVWKRRWWLDVNNRTIWHFDDDSLWGNESNTRIVINFYQGCNITVSHNKYLSKGDKRRPDINCFIYLTGYILKFILYINSHILHKGRCFFVQIVHKLWANWRIGSKLCKTIFYNIIINPLE